MPTWRQPQEQMDFDYHEVQIIDPTGHGKKIYRPFLEVTLSKRGIKTFQVLGLLDSGADIIILPLHLAEYLEIPYKKFSLL